MQSSCQSLWMLIIIPPSILQLLNVGGLIFFNSCLDMHCIVFESVWHDCINWTCSDIVASSYSITAFSSSASLTALFLFDRWVIICWKLLSGYRTWRVCSLEIVQTWPFGYQCQRRHNLVSSASDMESKVGCIGWLFGVVVMKDAAG